MLVSLALWKFWDLSTASGFRYHPPYHLFFFVVFFLWEISKIHRPQSGEAPERVAPKKITPLLRKLRDDSYDQPWDFGETISKGGTNTNRE